MWFALAEAGGSEDAPHARGLVEKNLGKGELEEARRRVEQWQEQWEESQKARESAS